MIKKLVVGMLETNCYVIYDEETRLGACVDPGGSADGIISFLKEENIKIAAILLTHGHFDHIAALQKVKEYSGAPVYAGFYEQELLEKPEVNLSNQFGVEVSVTADHNLKDGEVLAIGEIDIKTLYTPGHTSGGVCFYLEKEKALFSGDTLFSDSVGRTDLPTGSMEVLYKSIREQLFILPDDVKVYPGHGSATSIGYEKKGNMII